MTTQPFPPPPQGTRKRVVQREVYMLLEDEDCTTFSSVKPTGEYVLTEEAAKAWVKDGEGKGWGNYDLFRDYKKLTLRISH